MPLPAARPAAEFAMGLVFNGVTTSDEWELAVAARLGRSRVTVQNQSATGIGMQVRQVAREGATDKALPGLELAATGSIGAAAGTTPTMFTFHGSGPVYVKRTGASNATWVADEE